MSEQREMPVYQSHKRVGALAIAGVEIHKDGSATIVPQEEGYAPFRTQPGWGERFKGDENDPGVYVLYRGGYESWSPTKAFQEGYTRV